MDATAWTNIIAILALIISILSAVFSWRSAAESKIANRLSIHAYQKGLHEAFLEAYRYLYANGLMAETREFYKFGPHVKAARLYVTADLSGKLSEFYDLCLNIEDFRYSISDVQDELRLLEVMSTRTPEGDRYTAMQRETINAKLYEKIAVQTAGVKKAIELGSRLDKDFITEIKVR